MPATDPPGRTRLIALLLALLAIGLYAKTVTFDYALDDGVVILENRYVTSGLEGIPDLLTKDTFAGAFGEGDAPPGGRYRPLSLVTFAVEWEVFGRNPAVGHLVNVLLYAVTCLVLFHFIRRVARVGDRLPAFVATLLFLVHPVHTEVVANIKGRDEILVLLFVLLSTMALVRAAPGRNTLRAQATSVALFGMALLAKETGLLLLVIAPAALWCFTRSSPRRLAFLMLPHVALAALYLALRVLVTGVVTGVAADVLDAPYLYASTAERIATSLHVLGRYALLSLWPGSLAYDYSYAQIPYRNFSDVTVWASIAFHVAVAVLAVIGLRRRSAYGFGLVVYLVAILPVSNLIVDVGASPLGERFLYVPSVGIAVLAASLWVRLRSGRRSAPEAVVAAGVLVLALLGAAKTWARVPAWRDNETLFLADVETVPNSARAQNGAGIVWYGRAARAADMDVRDRQIAQATSHLRRAVEIHPRYVDGWYNLGAAYGLAGNLAGAETCLQRISEIRPGYPGILTMARELSHGYLERARTPSFSPDTRLDALQRAARFAPRNAAVIGELADTLRARGEGDAALRAAIRARDLAPGDPLGQRRVGDAAIAAGDTTLALAAWREALRAAPGDVELRRKLESLDARR